MRPDPQFNQNRPMTITQLQTRRDTEFCDIRFTSGISIIVPTYKEAQNIPHLLARIDAVRQAYDQLRAIGVLASVELACQHADKPIESG